MTTLKDLIASTYDSEAERYRQASEMQSGNLKRLLDLSALLIRRDAALTVLDVGCGLGNVVPELLARGLFKIKSYLGIDLSAAIVVLATRLHGSPTVSFRQGDAEALPVADASIDLVVSNSVLHWLNQPTLGMTPERAFREVARSLAPGGALIASIAGIGTGRRFRAHYSRVMDRLQREGGGFDAALYLADPIGNMQLHEVVDLALGAGLNVALAELDYEPARFPSAGDYCNAVRAYGFSVFMAAVPAERREAVWKEICRSFVTAQGGGPYVHDQYMCYLVARRA